MRKASDVQSDPSPRCGEPKTREAAQSRSYRRPPRSATPFFGRERELYDIEHLLRSDAGLVTLLGPAGIGKTRLANQLLVREHERGEPVFFCDLRGVDTYEGMIEEVGRTLGLQPDGSGAGEAIDSPVREALCAAPRSTLVLDNFEQLAGGPALETLSDWVRACLNVQFLVTSRRLLRLEEEVAYDVHPLPLPVAGDEMSSDALRLFLQRASTAEPSWTLAPTDLKAACAIVEEVEGVPLSIELAAGLLCRYSTTEVLKALRASQLDPERPTENTDRRHRSLRIALASSWTSLSPPEQWTASRLSVFRGGFTADAVADVLGSSIETLQALREASILRIAEGRDLPRRWDMYEATHEFMSEKFRLEDPSGDEARALRQRHAAYFATQGMRRRAQLASGYGLQAREWLRRERSNLESAFAQTVRQPRFSPHVVSLGLAYSAATKDTSPARSIETLTRTLASAQDSRPRDQARLRIDRAEAYRLLGDVSTAREDLCVAERLTNADPHFEASRLLEVGRLEMVSGHVESAKRAFENALQTAIDSDDLSLQSAAHTSLAWLCAEHLGDPRTFEHYQAALKLLERTGDHYYAAVVRGARNVHRIYFGRPTAASEFNEQMAVSHRFDDKLNSVRAHIGLALDAFRREAAWDALSHLDNGYKLATNSGLGFAASCCLMWIGIISEATGDHDTSAGRYEEATDIARRAGSPQVEAMCAVLLAHCRARSGALDAAGLLAHGKRIANDRGDLVTQRMARFQEIRREVLRAVRLRRDGEIERSESLAERLRRRYDQLTQPGKGQSRFVDTLHSDTLRSLAARELASISREHPAVRVSSDGSAFQIGTGPIVSVGRGAVIRRVLDALVTQRTDRPGEGLSVDCLLRAGWPGEVVRADAGLARIKTVVGRLRRAGLARVLRTVDGKYLLDPAVPVTRADSAAGNPARPAGMND